MPVGDGDSRVSAFATVGVSFEHGVKHIEITPIRSPGGLVRLLASLGSLRSLFDDLPFTVDALLDVNDFVAGGRPFRLKGSGVAEREECSPYSPAGSGVGGDDGDSEWSPSRVFAHDLLSLLRMLLGVPAPKSGGSTTKGNESAAF